MAQLNISINPHNNDAGADLWISNNHYPLDFDDIKSEQDLRILLSDQPDYVYNAVVGLLKEMAS